MGAGARGWGLGGGGVGLEQFSVGNPLCKVKESWESAKGHLADTPASGEGFGGTRLLELPKRRREASGKDVAEVTHSTHLGISYLGDCFFSGICNQPLCQRASFRVPLGCEGFLRLSY